MARISMKPVTFRRIVETVDLSVKLGIVDEKLLSVNLKTTKRRAHEILVELHRMKLLNKKWEKYNPEKTAIKFVDAFEREEWSKIHSLLFDNYPFYHTFFENVTAKFSLTGFSKDDLRKCLIDQPTLNFNQVAIDLLLDWSERLGVLQRNLFTGHYYLTNQSTPFSRFPDILQKMYDRFNFKPRPGMRQEYVEIARIRESVCEEEKMKRDSFDLFLKKVFQNSRGRIELCGAPITSRAKKIPLSLRKIKRGTKDSVLSPKYLCLSDAQGIEINGKEYHYIAIFESIRLGINE